MHFYIFTFYAIAHMIPRMHDIYRRLYVTRVNYSSETI